jgi:hypothetical protein
LAQPFGTKGDNNKALAGIAGLGLNLLDGNLTILALTHIGPENPSAPPFAGAIDVNGTNRYFNDIVATLKVNEALTLTTELNYVRDDAVIPGLVDHPSAYGIAQYASYTLNDVMTLQARAEIWRDDQGFYAFAFPGNFDFTNAGRGIANGSYNGSRDGGLGKSTYEEITLGVNFKPAGLPKPFDTLMFRPEIRYDHSEDAKPFNNLKSDHQVTIAADAILSF